ncbi:MAG: Rpn family recombination-promoting nuclease/putative transposase [Planctomyces sp.]
MPIGINPLVDYAFKMLFGCEMNVAITIHFLNAVLKGQPKITKIKLINPIRQKQTATGKLCILDILAEDQLGRQLNIEVQISLPAGMEKRMVYYTAETYVRQLQEGQNYNALQPSISICVLAGALIRHPGQLHLDFRLRERSHHLTLTDDLQIHFLQLKYLQVTAETLYNATDVERWCWFLSHADKLTTEQISQLLPEQEFSEAAGVLEMIARTPSQLLEYNARLKAHRDEEAKILHAQQQGIERGIEIGEAKGIEIGEARGIEIGEARGIEIGEARGIEIGEQRGESRGIRRGMLHGQILQLQQLLGQAVLTEEQLAACDIDQLNHLLADLQQRFNSVRS